MPRVKISKIPERVSQFDDMYNSNDDIREAKARRLHARRWRKLRYQYY